MYAIQTWGDTLRLLVELSATVAFALSGLMEAARKRLDALLSTMPPAVAVLMGLITVGLHALALWRNWQLPIWRT